MGLKVTRRARASWQGTVPDGGGRIGLGSGAYEGDFSLRGRMEDTALTNPEELIGAAHAGCFTMSLANVLSEQGHPPRDLQTAAKVVLEQTDSGFTITRIELDTTGLVDGIDEDEFQRLADQAEKSCPISRALTGTEIVMSATLRR